MMTAISILNFLVYTFFFTAPLPKDGDELIVSQFATKEKKIVLTFDACESKTPSYFDSTILNYLVKNKIPATIFLGGKFAQRNKKEIKQLCANKFLEFENHSFDHIQHMEKLSDHDFLVDIRKADSVITSITGQKTRFFRFPGGNYDKTKAELINKQGYQIVHWTFATGDPDKNVTSPKMIDWVTRKVRPGSVVIFHINGRGYHTGEALPHIIDKLRSQNYSFILLKDALR